MIGTVEEKKANVTPISEKGKKQGPGNYKLVSLTLVPGKATEQICLEAIPSSVRDGGWQQPTINSFLSPPQHCPWWSQYRAKQLPGSIWGMRSFRFLGEGLHIFTLSDCVYGRNILVAGICLSAMRLLLYFLHSLSMLSGGASFLL